MSKGYWAVYSPKLISGKVFESKIKAIKWAADLVGKHNIIDEYAQRAGAVRMNLKDSYIVVHEVTLELENN